MAWHLATRQTSLCTRENFASFLHRCTPENIRCFQDLEVPLYIIATDLLTGHRYLFGEDPKEHIVDAILASTAIPPIFSPWFYQGRLLVDGGVSDNLPIGVAVEKGATQIFALDIIRDGPVDDGHWNVMEVATQSLMDLIAQQRNRDLSHYSSIPGINLFHLPLYASRQLAFDDFDHASRLIEDGRQAAEAYLLKDYSLKVKGKSKFPQRNISRLMSLTKELVGTFVSRLNIFSWV
jgi:NTE family protein